VKQNSFALKQNFFALKQNSFDLNQRTIDFDLSRFYEARNPGFVDVNDWDCMR
jgi:hypothetical protein